MSALGVTVRPTGNVCPRWFWFLRSPQPHNTPDRKRAPEASVSTAAVAGLQGPPGGCAHPVRSPGAGANGPPWYPSGRAERRRLPLPPPAGPGSREESRVSHCSPRLRGSGATTQPRLTRNTGTSWTPSWSPTLMSWLPCVEPCKCSSSQAMPYTVMLATTVNAYLRVRAGA